MTKPKSATSKKAKGKAQADPFAMYTLPIGISDGVEIPLPNTEAVFRVRFSLMLDEDF